MSVSRDAATPAGGRPVRVRLLGKLRSIREAALAYRPSRGDATGAVVRRDLGLSMSNAPHPMHERDDVTCNGEHDIGRVRRQCASCLFLWKLVAARRLRLPARDEPAEDQDEENALHAHVYACRAGTIRPPIALDVRAVPPA